MVEKFDMEIDKFCHLVVICLVVAFLFLVHTNVNSDAFQNALSHMTSKIPCFTMEGVHAFAI